MEGLREVWRAWEMHGAFRIGFERLGEVWSACESFGAYRNAMIL